MFWRYFEFSKEESSLWKVQQGGFKTFPSLFNVSEAGYNMQVIVKKELMNLQLPLTERNLKSPGHIFESKKKKKNSDQPFPTIPINKISERKFNLLEQSLFSPFPGGFKGKTEL